jgi:RAB protein geranylgeranyltransferase component A
MDPNDEVDELNSHFDAIIVGTGLTESILACSLARARKKVLHLDDNEYYGHTSTGASLCEFFSKCSGDWVGHVGLPDGEEKEAAAAGAAGLTEKVPLRDPNVFKRVIDYKEVGHRDVECVSSLSLYGNKRANEKIHPSCFGYVMDTEEGEGEGEGEGESSSSCHPVFTGYRKDHVLTGNRARFHARHFSVETSHRLVLASGAAVDTIISSDVARYLDFKAIDSLFYIHIEGGGGNSSSSSSSSSSTPLAPPLSITIDKVPSSKGEIFSSGILHALEKRSLMKLLQHTVDRGQRRAGHDASTLNERDLSMGRAIRRSQNTPDAGIGGVNEDRDDQQPFLAYLAQQRVSTRLQRIISHGLCFYAKPLVGSEGGHSSGNSGGSSGQCVTKGEALDTLYRHVDSIGRYGTTPFIACQYGSAEIAQAMCRMCAVWGGTYILGRGLNRVCYGPVATKEAAKGEGEEETTTTKAAAAKPDATESETETETETETGVVAVVDSTGLRISCSALVCNADYLPTLPSERQALVSAAAAAAAREVCVTRVSIVSGRVLPDRLGVAVIPPNPNPNPSHLAANADQGLGNPHCIQVVQLDDSSSVCPAGATLLYVLCSIVLPFFSCL